uniref:Pericentrin n=1 Tax=Fundulus heteroclitus TaxID=8078 RepID=A0A3Q2P6W8_FUNHE
MDMDGRGLVLCDPDLRVRLHHAVLPAQLASFRKKRAKGDGAGAAKKTQKGKGQAVTKNDGSTQDRLVDAHLRPAGATGPDGKTNPEQNDQQEDQSSSLEERSLSPVEDLREEELAALTGKEQLQLLQQAVEKRNEIIAKLSHNLQDALASRDQVQLEAQSLAGQIQALQKQLQQVSTSELKHPFGGADHHPGLSSQAPNIRHKEAASEGSGNAGPGSQQTPEGISTDSDTEADTVLHKLMCELEEERKNSQRLSAELAKEVEKSQHVLSLLEEEKQGREEEQNEVHHLQTQLSQVQAQCLVMQQYKEEKEKLNGEVLRLRKMLQEEEHSERRCDSDTASSALCPRALEEEKGRLEEEMKRLKEEVEHVRKLLDQSERQLQQREREVEGLKAYKNRENHAKAAFTAEVTNTEEGSLGNGLEEGDLDTSEQGDILMERYLSSVPPAHSHSSVVNESFCENEQPSQLDISPGVAEAGDSSDPFETNLEKQLLSQQCWELREELALKERDLGVLREEVLKSSEELEEARSRWAQVTEELQEALNELEEERERRRLVEEEMNLRAHEQDGSISKDGASMEERGEESVGTLMGQEAGGPAEPSLLRFTTCSSEYIDEFSGEINEEKEGEVSLLAPQNQEQLLVEMKPTPDSTGDVSEPSDEIQVQTLQMEQKTESILLSQKAVEVDGASEELETTRAQLLKLQDEVDRLQQELLSSQARLDLAGREKEELEAQIHSLREDLASLEEAQALSVKQREEEKRKEQQMDEQIKKMEQVLEEELEQFENIMKAKDAEVGHAWLKRRKNGRRRASHEQEIRVLVEKHRQEVSELNDRLETELLKQRVVMEEEQKRQISFIKEVTEREHERMMSELAAKHNEELEKLRTEVSLELRESMEAAHQAEMHQTLELEALRLSLTTVHMSQLETSQANLQQEQQSAFGKLQASMREAFTQEGALLHARHQSDLHEIQQQNKELQERLQKLHQQEIDELKQQWEARFAQERTSMLEKHDKEIQVSLSLSEIQNRLNATQTELINAQATLAETSAALAETRAALSRTQSDLQEAEEVQASSKEQVQKLEEELKQARADKDAAASSLEELIHSHKTALQEKEQQLLHLEEKEQQLQQEVTRLQEEKTLLKKSSEEEMGQLWTQLESMRASRQELGELKEQLVARSSQVEDIERLKTEFREQKREIKGLHEAELENLRKYFEKRLHASEETYKEEIALLQLRLVESALEESVMKTNDLMFRSFYILGPVSRDASWCWFCLMQELVDSLRRELEEKHAVDLSQLESSLALSYKEELQQERSDLTDHYYQELQEMKTRHALELEQLRARLSESHLQGASLYALFLYELRWFHLSLVFKELALLGPQLLMVKERLEAEYDDKLQKAKNVMAVEIKELQVRLQEQNEEKLRLAQQRYEKSVAELEDKRAAELQHERTALLNKRSEEMNALDAKHKAQLDSLSACHRDQLAAMVVELEKKHKAELDLKQLEAAFQETGQAQLEALEADLCRRHQEERDELEKRMLGNMDTLEATYLKEVQVSRYKHRQALISQSSEHKRLMERQAAETQSAREELKRELAQLHMDKFKAMAAELSHVHKTELAAQKETLDTEHCKALEALKQQELRGTSARELDACRRELEEESARQRQHFLEEAELLKVQSEERLQDKINQLKTEFEERKEVELEELRRSFTSQQQEKEQSYTSKMSQLTTQLQQLDAVVTQLREEIGCLQEELHGKRSEMETLDTLLQRRERESQEGGNLLKMLTDDLQDMSKVLIEMLRSVIATEELIGQKINMRIQTNEQTMHKSSTRNKDQESGISVADLTSEDMELTQMLCESLLVTDTQINPGGEESALKACSRLRVAVETLLDLLNQAHAQLEQTCSVHLTLEEKFSQGREDTTQLIEQHKLVMKQLDEEAKLKSRLQLELHKAEGLLEGYVAEKAALEESLQQKEALEEKLVEELEDYQELTEEHGILLRHKEHLSAGLGEREKGEQNRLKTMEQTKKDALLAETERLTQDRLDLQRQAEKDHKSLSLRLRNLERELEDQETKRLEKELQHKSHTEDLSQRVQALEKQLKHDRQFIEEQAVEREHERDEFQQEIRRLEAQLKHTSPLPLQVESLQAIIRDKTEDHAFLLEANQQAQRDLAERNEEIDKLAGRIRELEQALLNSAESVRTVSEMEQELNKAKLREQELTQDKLALEQQQLSSRLQISALQSKLDETRHRYHDNTRDPTHELRDALDAAQQNLHCKEQEVYLGQLENLQRDSDQKEAELKHLTSNLRLFYLDNSYWTCEQTAVFDLKETMSTIAELNEEKKLIQDAENEETLPAALLQEKNQEIDHLNCEIQKLEQELESARHSKALEGELEDLRSQVEHLQSEIARVRQEKQEEEERLHEVISTLQAELATLGPNVHEVSDSQDGDSINPSPSPSPEPHAETPQERRGGPNSLKHEISLTHSAASSSLRSHLKALQSQLDAAVAEKEGLERLLLTQEEEYRAQGEEFGRRLGAEREKLDEIQGLLRLRETELEQEKEKKRLCEEERDSLKVEAEEAKTTREEKALLNSAVLDLQKSEQERARELEALKTKMKLEMELEKVVAEGRERITALEAVKGELSAEREALRRRERQLQEEISKLREEVGSMKVLVQELTLKLREKESSEEELQKEVLTHADVTLAKADAALRQKESEFAKLKAENEALNAELAAVKQALSSSSERAAKLHQKVGGIKDRDLVDLEAENERMRAELERLQEDVVAQEEELAYQRRELEQLRQQQDAVPHHQDYRIKAFEELLTVSRDEASLSSPEVLRRLERSEDRLGERFHASVLDSRLSELSGLNCTGPDPPQAKTSPRVAMEPPHSRTITPDPATQSTHSPGSMSVSDHFSALDSLDPDKLDELEELDLTAPPSPHGSISSFSAQEWNSDGYGSNVSSELGARLRVELEQTERLDAQFVQYLRCRGINPTANTDSAAGSMSYSDDLLSPELQGLLKKVYQESCRILTLSQRRSAPSSQPNHSHRDDSASFNPPMSWQQEKRALQETVVALRELLCRMAQRQTQVSFHDLLSAKRPSTAEMCPRRSAGAQEQNTFARVYFRHFLYRLWQYLKYALKVEPGICLFVFSRLAVEEAEEALRSEQTRFQELQQEVEQERALSLRKNRETEERREVRRETENINQSNRFLLFHHLAVQVSSEKLKCEVLSLKGQVEQERVACSNLRQELQIEQSRSVMLENRLEDAQKELDEERKRFTQEQQRLVQEKSDAERLLNESRSKLEEERRRCFRQMDELSRRHQADSARDQKFLSDLRSQLEQERRQAEDLASVADKLRAELLQSRRKREEEDGTRLEELQREKEAAAKHRVAADALKEQKLELSAALETEQQRSRRLDVELSELKERLQVLREKERERDDELEKERRKERQELVEREMREQRTNNKLMELELLRRRDQQRMQELQQTLTDLEREEREMAAQRLSGQTSAPYAHTDGRASASSSSSSNLLETVLKENGELTERVTALSQERATYKSRLAGLEKQLRRTEAELAKVTAETENRPVGDSLQRYYERYLRAESFRKALVYQKRYLLLLLGGFQDCEQATLCLIARMGVRPSPPLIPQRRPLCRFRAVVRVVIAVSRMKFLTRKWQRAIRRVALPGTTSSHAPADVLRQQQPRINSDSGQNRDNSVPLRDSVSSQAPPGKSSFRLPHSNISIASAHSAATSQDPERSLTEYIHHLEKVQQRLVGTRQGELRTCRVYDQASNHIVVSI